MDMEKELEEIAEEVLKEDDEEKLWDLIMRLRSLKETDAELFMKLICKIPIWAEAALKIKDLILSSRYQEELKKRGTE